MTTFFNKPIVVFFKYRDTVMNSVVFGTGPLGLWVANILKEQEKAVTLVNRSGKISSECANNIKLVMGDANKPDVVAKICRDANADTIFHCAMPPYSQWVEEFPALTKGILEGAKIAGCKLVYGDNLYGYGDTQGDLITESLAYNATGHKGKVRAAMATLLLNEKGVDVVIGRGSDFYGSCVLNNMLGKSFFEPALSGKKVNLLGNIDLPHTHTYVKDFANALVKLGTHDEAFGQVWHIPNAPTITTREFIEIVEKEINKPIKVQTAGRKMVSFLGIFNPMLREMKEMMYSWDQAYIVSHEKYKNTFGNNFTPHEVAIRETVEWWNKYKEPNKLLKARTS